MRVLKKTRKHPRLLAILLCVAILLPSLNGLSVSLGSEPGLCLHHQRHDETCGYSEGTPGAPCNHEHTEDCYVTRCLHTHTPECYPPQQPEEPLPEQPEEPLPEQPEEPLPEQPEEPLPEQPGEQPEEQGPSEDQPDSSIPDALPPLADEPEPTLCQHQCSLESGCVTLNCPHQHDQDCGYVPPTPGTPCQFLCPLCVTGWEWVDEEGFLLWDEATGTWGLGLPGISEDSPLTRETLDAMLPTAAVVATAAGERTAELSWNYGAFPDSASAGTYALTASLAGAGEGDYLLASGVPELSVLLDLGGGEMYADKMKFLNQWNFITKDGTKLLDNSANVGIRNLSTMSQADIVQYLKDNVLPTKIRGWVSASDVNNVFGKVGFSFDADNSEKKYETTVSGPKEVTDTSGSAYRWGRVDIQWDMSAVPAQITDGTTFTLRAYIPTVTEGSDTYNIYVNSNDPADYQHTGSDGNPDLKDTKTNPGILNFPVSIYDFNPSNHIKTPANPDGTHVNLFDYCVDPERDGADGKNDLLKTTDVHKNPAGDPVERTGVDDWKKGINEGHLLLFGDGNIHAGLWNKGAGAASNYGKAHAGTMGIVRPTLENNYPVINTDDMDKLLELDQTQDNDSAAYKGISDWQLCGDHNDSYGQDRKSDNVKNISNTVQNSWDHNASLDYLFDPKVTNSFKRAYEDVQGLFQIDDEGYYYYDMRQNFAEYDESSNKFILYDAPAAQRTDNAYENGNFGSQRSVGNFLPFNTAEQVFDGIKDGKLYSSERISTHNDRVQNGIYLDHHLGMTLDINFRQPEDGKINMGASGKQPMTFLFSGDDDVWVYIDDVLVLDLGGIHSEIYGAIDFSTGQVSIGQSWKTNGFPRTGEGKIDVNRMLSGDICTNTTTIRERFQAAGVEWTSGDSDTFTGNTNHTLRMFFLERGNYDSSLAVRFNLQPQLSQQVKKVDQDGKAMEGVEFALYPAARSDTAAGGAVECLYTDSSTVTNNKKFYVKQDGSEALAHLKTDADGVAQFLNSDGTLFNFAQRGAGYYILKETKTPPGYRSLPIAIALYYDPGTGMVSVANRWSTGAYACSVSNIIGVGKLTYGAFDETTGDIQVSKNEVDKTKQSEGLVVAVPMLWHRDQKKWEALYGGNIDGFDAVMPETRTAEAWRNAVLTAALHQAGNSGTSDWHLTWDGANQRLLGTLNDLPGLASRYRINNPNGDMRMVYGIIEPKALEALGIHEATAKDRYEALRTYLNTHTVNQTLETIMGVATDNTGSGKGFSFLNVDQFNRNFRSLVYIPNEQRELVVQKVDQDGNPLKDAEFTLFSGAQSVAFGTTDENGALVFSPAGQNGKEGQAQMVWANSADTHYTLKETKAPDGYPLNSTEIPIVVGVYSIYADAGKAGDGVSVMAGVGRLTQTMRQYARDNDVDITLQDITAFMQTQPANSFTPDGWSDAVLSGTNVPRSINLHFGMNLPTGYRIDYGLHDADITGQPAGTPVKNTTVLPVFVTDEGFIRTRVQQNYPALAGEIPKYSDKENSTNKDNLGDIDLTSLFSLLNVVVVTDRQENPTNPTGKLQISKTVTGDGLTEADYTADFTFTLELKNSDGKPLDGDYAYHFWGSDKAGTIKNGGAIILRHDDTIIIDGLPVGTRYTVTETAQSGWYVKPASGSISGTVTANITAEAGFTNSKDPENPPTDPENPPTDPENPPTDPENPPTDPENPPTDPGNPPTDPENPPTDPENPPTDPENPPTDPENPPTDPENPPTDPGNPPTDPENPPTAPENPPTDPENPGYPTELPDPNDPDSPDEITIWDDGVPKTYIKVWDPELEEWIYILDEDVPLTGDRFSAPLWGTLFLASLAGLAVLHLRKRR